MRRWIVAALVVVVPMESFASTFKILGLRPMGMGGANTAIAEGPTAQYWNPGALALTGGSGFQIPIGVQFEATGNVLQKADSVAGIADQISALQKAQKNGGELSLTQVRDFNDAVVKLSSLNEGGTGVLAGAMGGVDVRVKHVAVSVNNFTEAGITPFVDTKFDLGAIAGAGGVSLSGNGSLNNSADSTSRDQVATVITNLSAKFGITLAGGATPTSAANKLVNDARNSGLTTQQIADLATQAQTLNAQLASSGVTGAGAPALHGARSPAAAPSGIVDIALANNSSNVTLRGASLSELSFGYGYPLPIEERFGELGVGANLKMIRGDVAYAQVNIVNGQSSKFNDLASDFSNNKKTTYKPAADMGLLWRAPLRHRLQLGFLARNINSPTFSQPDTARANGEPDYKESIQSRAGIAFWPLKRLVFASDIDVSKNATAVPGFASRNWGAGAELNVLFLSLRAGILKNIAEGTPLSYTAGVGLNIWALKIDLAGAMSSKTVQVNSAGATVPTSFQAGLSVGLVFGGGPSHPTKKAPRG